MNTKENIQSPYKGSQLRFSDFSTYRNAIYGVAALWIALFHGVILPEITLSHRLIEATFEMGNIGVDMFIFLSGVSMYMAWNKQYGKGLKRYFTFAYKRMIRIYVPFLVVAGPVIVWLCLYRLDDTNMFWNMITAVSYWTKQYEFINLWFVSAIIIFYLLYPLIHKLIFIKPKGEICRLLMLLLISVSISVAISYWHPEIYRGYDVAITRIPIFIVGSYAGKLVSKQTRIPMYIVIASIAIFILSYPLYVDFALTGIVRRYFGSLCGLAVCFILIYIFKILSNIKIDKLFGYFGDMSLEIYMYTIIMRSFYCSGPYYFGEYWVKYLIVIILSLGLSSLVLPFEKHAIKLCNKVIYKIERKE